MKLRRVITGHAVNGQPKVVIDQSMPATTMALLPGWEIHRLWGYDEVPPAPNPGKEASDLRFYPERPNGVRFMQVTIPPASTPPPPANLDMAAAAAEADRLAPGLVGVFEPEEPGMHRTDTIDFILILEGRVILDLGGGQTVELGPHDTAVQNGTRHKWYNPFNEPCRLLGVLIGVSPRG
jgi:mannose-6-phosphate isomerase-like protein (cupin superfamily)